MSLALFSLNSNDCYAMTRWNRTIKGADWVVGNTRFKSCDEKEEHDLKTNKDFMPNHCNGIQKSIFPIQTS